MKLSSSLFATASLAVLPFTARGFVPTITQASGVECRSSGSSSSSSLHVSVGETQLKPPKKVADLAKTSEDLYNKNVQTTYGYVVDGRWTASVFVRSDFFGLRPLTMFETE
jgi:hypothetical protein